MNQSLENRQKLEETLKRRGSYIRACMTRLAVGLGVEVTAPRVDIYAKELSDLEESQIKQAFQTALREYKPFGGSFPSPAELREFAKRGDSGMVNDAPEILSRDTKPPDWKPISPEELEELKRKVSEAAAQKAMR